MSYDKREIFFGTGYNVRPGSYHMCNVIFWEQDNLDYIIVETDEGKQFIAHQSMGTWCAISAYDLLYKLRFLKRQNELIAEETKEEIAKKICPDCAKGRHKSYHSNFIVNHHWKDNRGICWGSDCKAGKILGYERRSEIPKEKQDLDQKLDELPREA